MPFLNLNGSRLLMAGSFLLFSLFSTAQSFSITLDQDGMQFYLTPRLALEEVLDKEGKNTNLLGSRLYRVSFQGFALDPVKKLNGIDYKGTHYGYHDFDGALIPYFDKVEVTSVSMTVYVEGLKDCKLFSYAAWQPGNDERLFCEPLKDVKLRISDVKISSAGTSGVIDLQNKIRELERAKAQAEKNKQQVEALLELGDAHADNNRFADALSAYQKAAGLQPDNDDITNRISRVKQQQKDLADAEKRKKEQAEKEKQDKEKAEKEKQQQELQQKEQEKKQAEQLSADEARKAAQAARNDSIQQAQKKYFREKWVSDSTYREEQYRKKKEETDRKEKFYSDSEDEFDREQTKSFKDALKRFEYYSEADQQKMCEQAEGFAANADLFASMGNYMNATALFQRAAMFCPVSPNAYKWLSYAQVEHSFSLRKYDTEAEARNNLAQVKQGLDLQLAMNNVTGTGITNLYSKFMVEQGYRKLYEQARTNAEQYTNLFMKMSDVNIKFTDPATLNEFMNTRVKIIDANYQKAMSAAGVKAGAEFDQTYAATGSVKAATNTSMVGGVTDVLSNTILAEGAKKDLRRQRETQLYQIGGEFAGKLIDNCNAALKKMEVAKTEADDKTALSAFFYNYQRLSYACSNFSYANNNWYYNSNFPTTLGSEQLNKLSYLDRSNANLCAAERKMYFAGIVEKYKYPGCTNLGVWASWNKSSYDYRDAANAFLEQALKASPSNAYAYHLLSVNSSNRPEAFMYAFTAAQYSAGYSPSLFNGYQQKKQDELNSYLNQLLNRNNAEAIGEWSNALYYQLCFQLKQADFTQLLARLVREDKTAYLQALLETNPRYRENGFLEGLALSALKQNKGRILEVIKKFLSPEKEITLDNTKLNFLQLAIIENKHLAFAGMTGAATNYSAVAASMKNFSGNYTADNLYRAMAMAAVWQDNTAPLEYLRSVNSNYLRSQLWISDSALKYRGRVQVINWLASNQFLDKSQLGRQLYKVTGFDDMNALLKQGADINTHLEGVSYTVLNIQLQRIADTIARVIRLAGRTADYNEMPGIIHPYAVQANNMVALMLQNKADVLDPVQGLTVYQQAAGLGDVQIMKRLLQNGKEKNAALLKTFLNKKDKNGNTALHMAIKNNRPAIAALLIEAGANTNEKDNEGKTVKELIKKAGMTIPEPDESGNRAQLCFALEDAGAMPYLLNKYPAVAGLGYIQPVASATVSLQADMAQFKAKKFASAKDVLLSTPYFRSAAFLNAVKYALSTTALTNSYNTVWKIESADEIKDLRFITLEQSSSSQFYFHFTISLQSAEPGKVSMDADLKMEVYYESDGRLNLYMYENKQAIQNVRLQKQLNPGETAIFYKPVLFLNNPAKLEMTSFNRDYSAKSADKQDILTEYFYKSFEEDKSRDLVLKGTPEFVLITNKSKSPTTVSAYWK